MLKGFVSGEEKDIVRIPMKGKNLFDKDAFSFSDNTTIRYVPIYVGDGVFTLSTNLPQNSTKDVFFFSGNVSSGASSSNNGVDSGTPRTRSSENGYVTIATRYNEIRDKPSDFDYMLNLGSTPLPYEPYGYQEGWEVRDSQDRLIWGREDELQTATGTFPFKGYALPVKVKSLLGNAVQNGTPAPDNIITPEMCGVRTGNLFDISTAQHNKQYDNNGNAANATEAGDWYATDKIPVDSSKTYIRSVNESSVGNYIFEFDANKEFIAKRSPGYGVPFQVSTSCKYIGFNIKNDSTPIDSYMLNSGSTPLPYEPYGWKIPFENHGENLFDDVSYFNNTFTPFNEFFNYREIQLLPNTTYTLSTSYGEYVASNNTRVTAFIVATSTQQPTTSSGGLSNISPVTITTESDGIIKLYKRISGAKSSDYYPAKSQFDNGEWLMLNLGSTPKPYSPYLNATIPVYLGEVPTVRRVRKLVLTGQESWTYQSEYSRFYTKFQNSMIIGVRATPAFCTHYQVISDSRPIENVPDNSMYSDVGNMQWFIKTTEYTTEADFQAYLASEYAAGHPVTVWYVTSEPETTISNEPLCKISTYADELTTIQAHGLSAPLYGIGDYKDTLNLSTGVVTRKVKKIVLDGVNDGEWKKSQTRTGSFYLNVGANAIVSLGLCDRAVNVSTVNQYDSIGQMYVEQSGAKLINLWLFDTNISLDDFKSYLAAQYAAGAPVTIWYVLSTPETETVTVPTGMTGEIEGYLTQVSTPSPKNRSVPKWNGVEETGGTYAVAVYTPPEIPTTTGQNTLTVDSNLAPSKLEVSIHAKKIHYGFKIDKSNDDSDSAVIYTHDAVTMTPAHMDFTNDRFDYGSWGNAFFVRDCYPVALNLDGTIAYRLDPDDYTKKTDGTASDIFYELLATEPSDWSTQWKQYYTKDANDNYELNSQGSAPTFAQDTYYKLTYNSSFTGNFMMAFPKVWFYRHEDSQYNYIEISNYKLSDDWKCYAHINASGQEVDFIYLPLFKGVIVNSKLRSLPGQIPQGNTTATDEVNAATALGSRWQIWDHSSVECLNDLLTLMSKSIDSQGRYGAGRSSAYNASDTVTYGKLQSGTLIKKGKFHGYSSGYKDVKVFGIESLWANRYDRIQGLLLANGVWKVKMTPPYNFTGTDFVTLSSASVPTDAGYLSRVQTSEYGSIPAATISTSGKYFKDFFYRYSNDTCVPLRGGNCGDTDIAGYRFIYAGDPASRTVWSFGASPVYK